MAVHPGRHQLGPDRGRIILRTFRDGLAATAGHDLTIEATRWSGVLAVNEDLTPADLNVHIEMGALVVREGGGGGGEMTAKGKDRGPAGRLAGAGADAERAFERRIGPTRDLAGQADAIAAACHAMALRFHQGGKLVVFGTGGASTDAQHVAVE